MCPFPGVFTMIMKQTVIPLNTSRARKRWEVLIGVGLKKTTDHGPQTTDHRPQTTDRKDAGLKLEQSFENVEKDCQ